MSYNQSRAEKNESTQYRKQQGRSSNSSNIQRSSAKGGGGTGPAPSLSSSRSFKKSSNAQGGHPKLSQPAAAPAYSAVPSVTGSAHNAPSIAYSHLPIHGASDTPVISGVPKHHEPSAQQRSTPVVPKAPTSQHASMSPDSSLSAAPVKVAGDASKGAFPFQFGSLSPGLMNGMQIPARTSSAPPNLDEQKQDQERHDTLRSVAPVPTPIPKQQPHKRDVIAVDKAITGDSHPIPKSRKETQGPPPPVSQSQKPPVLPFSVTSMPRSFHQAQPAVQFGGPNPQIQPHGVTSTSLQMPVPVGLPLGNAPQVQQPMFVQGLQPHPIQPQGIMHRGQSLSFTTQMGPQHPPQLSNMGIGISLQYPQQLGGKYGGQRKTTVKITDPNTHEELRLADGGSSGMRSHPNVPQSQQIHSFPPHAINYYPTSYGGSNIFFPPQGSMPLTTGQIAPNTHAPRYNYTVNPGAQSLSYMEPSAINSLPFNKSSTMIHGVGDQPTFEHNREVRNPVSVSSSAVQVTVKPAAASTVDKAVKPPSLNSPGVAQKHSRSSDEDGLSQPPVVPKQEAGGESVASESLPAVVEQAIPKQSLPGVVESSACDSLSSLSLKTEESVPTAANVEGRKREPLVRSNSIKDHQKEMGQKGYCQPQNQAVVQPTSLSSLPSRALDHGKPLDGRSADALEAKATFLPSSVSEGMAEISAVDVCTTDVSGSKADETCDSSSHAPLEPSVAKVITNTHESTYQPELDTTSQEEIKDATSRMHMVEPNKLVEDFKQEQELNTVSGPESSRSEEPVQQVSGESTSAAAMPTNEVLVNSQLEHVDPVNCQEKDTMLCQKEGTTSMHNGSADDIGTPNQVSSKVDDLLDGKVSLVNSDVTDHQPDTVRGPASSGEVLKQAGESVENTVASSVSQPGARDGSGTELSRSKSNTSNFKKKRKEILQKADAAGTTSDLYMAYKGPEEKKENIVSSEATESTSSDSVEKQALSDKARADGSSVTKGTSNKTEPEDWEDVVDVSTPKLETLGGGAWHGTRLMSQNEDGNAHSAKKYSRDFLLKFSERCCELPYGFEITYDILDVLMSTSVPNLVDRDPHPTPGRVVDRTNSSSRMDRRASGMGDDDKWSKLSGHFGTGRDLHVDIGFAGNAGFQSGQGGNFGVVKNARTQAPPQFHTGILAGPMQSMVAQGGVPRNSPDADRWQRATNFQQKGLIPSPQTPLQVMHKAERKYEVGKASDEEEAKQRQLKAILNKLTPQNFEKLFEQVKDVNIDNARTLAGVISQIFDKALMEPTFCEMYANFCYHLAGELPDFVEDNEKITFKRLLLNKCQEEFERGEKEQEEANRADAEGEIKQSPEEREEKRLNARRRMLGNIRLIGELYKKRMLTERIMHECIKKLLGQYQNPDEEDLESLCKLMSTIGEMIDHPKAKDHMDAYFDRMTMLSNNMKLSSRIRFMLKDSIDLRRNKWKQRRKVEGPKKIDDVHRDAAQERHSQASRLARSPSMNQSGRRTPMDFGPRGSSMLSPSTPIGGFRRLPNQARGFGNQDARFDERQPYEPRAVPLPQRPLGDDSITLGPQGGLARGMSGRGPSANASNPSLDPVESRRMMAAFNGFSNVSERSLHNSRENLLTRYGTAERIVVPTAYDQVNAQERNMNFVNKDPRNDRSFDRPIATSPPSRVQAPASTSEKELLEEVLRDKSLAAIKEYYSARDEREVALCIKELDSPSFHPSMVSFWVNDSFERKDMERDLLAKLLVNLTISEESILTQFQLVKGFESVLTSLEDIVNDAPRAAEFLGRIFGKAVSEKVVPLKEIGQLLLAGGEEPERLKEIGLAGDVIGSILETVKVEKGESLMNETKASSNLHLEDFRPKDGYRSRILEKFI